MSPGSRLTQCSPAIVAILRGIEPSEVVEVGKALVHAGIRIIEVPLNSPDALRSIERLAASVEGEIMVGAGTVLTAASVDDVATAGAQFVVSPNTDGAVIARTLERGLESMPGAMTPTEAMTAVHAGARHLKVFPASSVGLGHIRALRDVLPPDCCVWAVGGVSATNLAQWAERGAFGVGVGSSLYRPGRSASDVRKRAAELVGLW
jgi:2-dehydro-3-deoxyphosphogalactonate aldolase